MSHRDDIEQGAWDVLKKQDIPGVQAIMDQLYPVLETWWLEAIENALYRGDLLLGREEILAAPLLGINALSNATPDRRQRFEIEELLTNALMCLLDDAVSTFPPAVAQQVEEQSNNLMLLAAAFWGLSGPRSTARPLGLGAGSFADLEALVAGRIGTRRADVRRQVRDLVNNRLRGLEAASRNSVLELRDLLGVTSMRIWLDFTLDAWAYRWFNIGIMDDAGARGFRFFRVINNPPLGPDARTTPFCRHVHGKILDLEEVTLHVERYNDAVLRRDHRSMQTIWPLLTGADANDTSEGAGARFDREFRRLGLPPYHPRCRTIVEPIRRSTF